jgi:ATP-binding cassette, subfamily B, bacterial
MLALVLIADGICAGSLAAGFAVRSQLARSAQLPPAGPTLSPWAAGGHRWPALTRALLWPQRGVVALAGWLMLIDTGLALAAPLPLMVVVDHGLSHHPYPAWLSGLAGLPAVALATVAALAGLLLLAASATAGYLVTFLMGAVCERMTWRLRAGVVSHLLRAVPQRAARYPLGELTARVGADTARVADTVTGITETVIPDVTVLAGMIAVTAALDWRLTLVVLGVIPLYALTARVRNRAVTGASQQARACSGELSALAADLLARIPAVHVFGRAESETSGYCRASGRAAAAAVTALDAGARFAPVTETLPGLGLAGALIAGTIEVTAGRLSIGGLLVLLAYLSSLTGPVRSLARLSTTVARGTASKDRVTELLDLPLLAPAAAGPVTGRQARLAGPHPQAPRAGLPPTRSGAGLDVALAGVSYAHRPGQSVLSAASLQVPAGELLCLRGPSGTGKSTLLSLLVRLADPQAGLITIGGHDIAALAPRELRELVTLVPQDPWLHTGTIAENIGYGRPGATRADILAAAERAGVASFAASLPEGLETPVGEHGRQLSGGQQRRVAVARALLRDTPVLLLDEPTTGLDQATETRLVTDLMASARGKTVILVTHQARLAAMADRVVTLDQGVLTPAGTSRRLSPVW